MTTIKKYSIWLMLLSLIACTASHAPKGNISNDAQIQVLSSKHLASTPLVGGWYPVFFDKYDRGAVDAIVKNYQSGHIKKVVISYDKNYALAKQILVKLQTQKGMYIQFEHTPLEDGSAQFNHTRVVVVVYNK